VSCSKYCIEGHNLLRWKSVNVFGVLTKALVVMQCKETEGSTDRQTDSEMYLSAFFSATNVSSKSDMHSNSFHVLENIVVNFCTGICHLYLEPF